MTKTTSIVSLFEGIIRRFRMNGLGLVCFHRLGYKDLVGYKSHLTEMFNEFPSITESEAEKLASIITQFAQPEDSDLGNVDRNIEQAFADNSELFELRETLRLQAMKIKELEFDLEISNAERHPFKTILHTLAKNLKSGELAKKNSAHSILQQKN
jgi:hypothetical protein